MNARLHARTGQGRARTRGPTSSPSARSSTKCCPGAAFHRDSAAETMSAILREEPPDLRRRTRPCSRGSAGSCGTASKEPGGAVLLVRDVAFDPRRCPDFLRRRLRWRRMAPPVAGRPPGACSPARSWHARLRWLAPRRSARQQPPAALFQRRSAQPGLQALAPGRTDRVVLGGRDSKPMEIRPGRRGRSRARSADWPGSSRSKSGEWRVAEPISRGRFPADRHPRATRWPAWAARHSQGE
jgi:hypothetical protein